MLLKSESRNFTPFREVGRMVADRAGPDDLVLVHSIPAGVVGVARYIAPDSGLERSSGWLPGSNASGTGASPTACGNWREAVGRILLVRIHEVGQPAARGDLVEEPLPARGPGSPSGSPPCSISSPRRRLCIRARPGRS